MSFSIKKSFATRALMLISVLCFLGIVFAPYFVTAEERQCQFIEDLSPYQADILYQSYRSGEPYDLQLTAVAIAWQESRLGLQKVRYGNGIDFSVGVGHTLVYYKTKNMSIPQRSMWMQEMIQDDARSITIMISDILYWQNRSEGHWLNGVGMYNGGNTPNMFYAKQVAQTVEKLKACKF